jgi:hypothetical protein
MLMGQGAAYLLFWQQVLQVQGNCQSCKMPESHSSQENIIAYRNDECSHKEAIKKCRA